MAPLACAGCDGLAQWNSTPTMTNAHLFCITGMVGAKVDEVFQANDHAEVGPNNLNDVYTARAIACR